MENLTYISTNIFSIAKFKRKMVQPRILRWRPWQTFLETRSFRANRRKWSLEYPRTSALNEGTRPLYWLLWNLDILLRRRQSHIFIRRCYRYKSCFIDFVLAKKLWKMFNVTCFSSSFNVSQRRFYSRSWPHLQNDCFSEERLKDDY